MASRYCLTTDNHFPTPLPTVYIADFNLETVGAQDGGASSIEGQGFQTTTLPTLKTLDSNFKMYMTWDLHNDQASCLHGHRESSFHGHLCIPRRQGLKASTDDLRYSESSSSRPLKLTTVEHRGAQIGSQDFKASKPQDDLNLKTVALEDFDAKTGTNQDGGRQTTYDPL
ncbi:hypothetical protein BC629DRAFT_1446177 [Irpex lacteus]|nr:hypothetical protein BC629DRAFT_1446177 [Irpex lacteus]